MPEPTEFAPPPPPPPAAETVFCRIENPSARARVIYGGPRTDKVIHIPAGQKVEAELPDHVIDKLIQQQNLDPEDPGLVVTELGPAPPPPAPVERPSRRARPPRAA